jgi:hypothetical protein
MIPALRKTILTVAAAFLVWAALVVGTGGIQWRIGGVLFRSRDPGRALMILAALLAAQALLYRDQFSRDVERLVAALRRRAGWVAAALSVLLFAHAIHNGSFVATGSDSYGYVSQAYGWARGPLPRPYPLRLSLPFPSGEQMQIPLGYRAGQSPHTMVPTYASGLPFMMALGIMTMGSIGPYIVVPVFAALLVWFTFCLGRRVDGPITGVTAAVIAATSPIVLFQAISPMSDVPAGALWTGALLGALGNTRRSAFFAGVAAALGLLVRPNLLLLVAVLFVWITLTARGRERHVRVTLFSIPLVPAVLVVAAINAVWYGSPFQSGYGSSADIYAVANIAPNVRLYPLWLWQSQGSWILLAFLSIATFMTVRRERGAIALCWIYFLATLASYIAYSPFELWWYIRFLQPGLGALYVLMALGVLYIARNVPHPWGALAAAVVVLLSVNHTTEFALNSSVFGPASQSERRYVDVAEFIDRNLPENAVVFAMQHSGSIRIWGGRLTLRYDFIDPDWRSRIIPELERMGLHPYLGIDDWEAVDVRKHFGLPADRPLPWPYVARLRENGVTVYDLASKPVAASVVALEPGLAPRYSWPKEIVLKPAVSKD